MNITPYQVRIPEERRLGDIGYYSQHTRLDILPAYDIPAMRNVTLQTKATGRFSPVGDEGIFANYRPVVANLQHQKRNFPIVKATGVSIAQEETDAASDDTLVAELELLVVDCSRAGWDGYGAAAVSVESKRAAVHFISLLPSDFPRPELSADSDGFVTFEWRRSPRQTLLVSARPDLVVDYAALIGTVRAYGSEPFADELPEIVKILVQRVTKS